MGWLKVIEIPVSYVLVAWHKVFDVLGMDADSGWTWTLSIVGLVLTLRVLLIPLFVKQIKSTRAMQVLAPDLKKIQAKYKGKKDQASREAMTRETMALYQKHKTSPFASCLPLLVQAPIFIGLFRVLNTHLKKDGIGALTPELAKSMREATIFDAPLVETFLNTDHTSVKLVVAVLIAAMVSTTFLTQRQLTRKNLPASALEGSMAQQQKIMMYVLPFIFVISGPWFPVGVLIYWTTNNLWTMGQQFYVIRANPTPGSEAEAALKERRQRKAIARGEVTIEEVEAEKAADRGQRQQPQRKNRKRR